MAARPLSPLDTVGYSTRELRRPASSFQLDAARNGFLDQGRAVLTGVVAGVFLSATLAFGAPAFAENELSAKYGGGFDSTLVDQTCLVDKCSLQAKACLADDPSCRKGLTCTAKCLGDNACITGCMARYGDRNLDNLLKCTIEDNECIKIAILPGGSDKFGEEPRSPVPTVPRFNSRSLEGSWYKVVGYNPNYDCYACQRNTFSPMDDNPFAQSNKLQMDVEFSMPHLLPDGSPPPPKNIRETIEINEEDGQMLGSLPIGIHPYTTHETMVFDRSPNPIDNFVSKKGDGYARTAHSEGEMFGLSK
jgi:VDE lipocalin domain